MTSALTEAASSSREAAPAIDVPVLRRAAMDFLARREHSFFELKQKLKNKFPEVDRELLLQVLAQLREENLQSDQRFTESWVRYRKSRGFAYHHIRVDLASRRVDESLINQYLFEDDSDWELMATNLVHNRVPPGENLEYESREHRRLLRFLESRGFPHVVIRKAVSRCLGNKSNRSAA